jgi:hypothetical protein
MTHNTESEAPKTSRAGWRGRRYRTAAVAAVAVTGGLVLTPQVLPAQAAPATKHTNFKVVAPAVPAGDAWIQGTLTDQAGHKLDNVNVEVWSTDPTATEPTGSNLTYAGVPADGRHNHGVYRVQVPLNEPYTIVFSGVADAEDGDAYRMQSYGSGRPIMVRPGNSSRSAAAAAALVPGLVRGLGTTQLVHQGHVNSAVKVKAAKLKAGTKGKLTVNVTSHFVKDTTGKVLISVAGRHVKENLVASDHGKLTTRLPKLKAGKYNVTARYLGSKTVAHSKSKPTKITVKAKGKGKK